MSTAGGDHRLAALTNVVPRRLLLVVLLAALLATCTNEGSSPDGSPQAEGHQAAADVAADVTLSATSRLVEHLPAGSVDFTEAVEGATVRTGDELRTDATGSADITYADGSITRLGPETTYTLVELADDPPRVRARVDAGQTWHRVTDLTRTGGSYEVETEAGVAAVRGTSFAVWCAERSCEFAVLEGTVVVSTSRDEVRVLNADEGLETGRDGRIIRDVHRLDPEDEIVRWSERNLDLDRRIELAFGDPETATSDGGSTSSPEDDGGGEERPADGVDRPGDDPGTRQAGDTAPPDGETRSAGGPSPDGREATARQSPEGTQPQTDEASAGDETSPRRGGGLRDRIIGRAAAADRAPGQRLRDRIVGRSPAADRAPGRGGLRGRVLGRAAGADSSSDGPPGRSGDGPPGRAGDGPPGQSGDGPPGRSGDGPPGRSGDGPPGQSGDGPPGRAGDGPPGRAGDGPPGRASDGLPGRAGDGLRGRSSGPPHGIRRP